MTKYHNVVSLGFFCSPAIDLNKLNLRKASLPFDWILTPDFKAAINLIQNHFEDFLNEAYLYQLRQYPQYYRNVKYGVDFYHDFTPFKPLSDQLETVRERFERRISRFYQMIAEPTLFVRYIHSAQEAAYIDAEYENICAALKAYNPQNDIIFVANTDDAFAFSNQAIRIWYVDKDERDVVARHPLFKNEELKAFILRNAEQECEKPHKLHKQSVFRKLWIKGATLLQLYYHHDKTID